MHTNWIVAIIVLAMVILERLIVTKTTRMPTCQKWYQRFPLLHPNGLSIARLPMGVIAILFAMQGWWTAATLWFSFWMITDLSDGTIARNCHLETEMGKWLDPLSDKCMYFPALIFMSSGNYISGGLTILPLWLVIIFIILDTIGQFSRLFVKKKAANSFGKAKTAMVTVLLSLISFNQIQQLKIGDFVIMNNKFVLFMFVACTLLAFMSFYCKVVPDFLYADTLILLNLLCGISAIVICPIAFSTSNDKLYVLCFILVFLGQFFDLFDGRLAQKFGSTPHGEILDIIADIASFGFGIASIIFWSLAFSKDIIPPWLAFIIALVYLVSMLYNYYRYHHPTAQLPHGFFNGLPISAGAALAASGVLVCMEFTAPVTGIVAALLVCLASGLMISRLPYLHVGQTILPNTPRAVKLVLGIVALIFICFTTSRHDYRYVFVWCCLLVSLVYVLNGIDWKLLTNRK